MVILRRVDSNKKLAASAHTWCSILAGYEIIQNVGNGLFFKEINMETFQGGR